MGLMAAKQQLHFGFQGIFYHYNSYVFLNVALVLFFVMKKYRFIWLLAIQSFFLSLSFILEISAFAVAV
jgi:hypothetical protein